MGATRWHSLRPGTSARIRATDASTVRLPMIRLRAFSARAAPYDARKKRLALATATVSNFQTVQGKEPPPEKRAEQEELRGKVLAGLRSLPEEYRLPLTLRYIAGADYDAIQMQLGLTNGSL